jgi:hypothetical protein
MKPPRLNTTTRATVPAGAARCTSGTQELRARSQRLEVHAAVEAREQRRRRVDRSLSASAADS